ncbi:MAG: hypothetical protein D6727_00990 [Gammaproteobacteria bacterium]|nr:MAG: hypothetical protein D6727_00990 [Gammaproteobacteria bacterium]
MASKANAAKASDAATGDPFQLSAVEPIDPPVAGESGKWCRYTITQGHNVITGYRKGSRTAVTKAAKLIVADLNERRFGRRGRIS